MKINHYPVNLIFVASFILMSLWIEAEGYAVVKSPAHLGTAQPIRRFLRLRTIPVHATSPILVKDNAKSTTAAVTDDIKTEDADEDVITTDSASSSVDSESSAADAANKISTNTESEGRDKDKPLEITVARYQPTKDGVALDLDPLAEVNISEGRFFFDWFSSPEPYPPVRPPYGPPPGPGYYPPRPSVVDDLYIQEHYDEPQYEDCVTFYDHDTHQYFDECTPIPPPYFK